jgi:predicted N-acetyltransferase YhbS
MIIRQEKPEDIDDIQALNELALGQPQEAILKYSPYMQHANGSK